MPSTSRRVRPAASAARSAALSVAACRPGSPGDGGNGAVIFLGCGLYSSALGLSRTKICDRSLAIHDPLSTCLRSRGLTLHKCSDERLGLYHRGLGENGILRSLVTRLSEFRVAEARGRFAHGAPSDLRDVQRAQSSVNDLLRDVRRRQSVVHDGIESPKQGAVEQCCVVRCTDDQTLRVVLLEELEKRVQDASDLSNVIR